ncbi:class I adenylate cyclase [Methylomonas sp. CM2]|uniref:class I adenylate cyclase n=1 Tax=Methylomonas sp. CM2 TaxID=3417647 RepID=UPI003CE9044C
MINRLPAIQLGAPGEDISRKDLQAVVQRFKHFNQQRLQRVQSLLQPRQQEFLKLLPLLFHQNHPLLPGFIALDTPAGIPDYAPSKQTLDAAKQFSKGFAFKRKALRQHPIDAIYLMGSVGSMAFSRDSDIDIWLCHAPGLAADQLAELEQKARDIEKWAASLKLETHFFLMDAGQFARGENTPISKESSGETQHYLLLEEFYRTSIYIAGRIPLWWLVPPEQDHQYPQYVKHLLENRFVSEPEVIDFGGMHQVPVAEFASATLWHIFKSLTSPHKSLLKLFLMESYASEFPTPQWLCLAMKRAIYQGEFSVDSLDPYLMIYSKVDAYLRGIDGGRRLELARECFYLKIVGTGAAPIENRARQMQQDFLREVAEQWQWPDDLLDNLATVRFWDIAKAGAEHAVIRQQLQQCLKMILQFVGMPLDQAQRENQDLKLVGRKLKVELDLRPDKIEVLSTRQAVQNKPDLLVAAEVTAGSDAPVWYLFTERPSAKQLALGRAIKQGDSLLELLCWAVINGLYKKSINLHVLESGSAQAGGEAQQLLNELNQFLTRHLLSREADLAIYNRPNRVQATLLLVNWREKLPVDSGHAKQLVMSERADPLSYGDNRLCFVLGMQRLSISVWGEATLHRYSGLEGVFSCLTELFNDGVKPPAADQLQVLCYTPVRGRSIVGRLEALFARLTAIADRPVAPYQRYVTAAGGGYAMFAMSGERLSYYLLDTQPQLLQELAKPHGGYAPVFFDDYVLEQTYIPFLYQYNQPDTVQLFYHVTSKHVGVYIVDEHGALYLRQHANAGAEHVLAHYSVFFSTLIAQDRLPQVPLLKYYEIYRNSAGVISCHPAQPKLKASAMELSVRIAGETPSRLGVYCNERWFPLDDPSGYGAVRQHILGYRKASENYPFHITEIEVPCQAMGAETPDRLQTVHFLNFKQKIEDKLNI